MLTITPADTTLEPVVAPHRLRAWQAEGREARLLDVRTSGEFEAVHIPGAYNVPLDTLAEHGEEIRHHVSVPVILVCRTGSRARQAEAALRAGGMENLHVLEGGMVGWEAAGLVVRRGERRRWSLERQVRLAAGALVLAGVLGSLAWPPLVAVAGVVGAGLVFAGATDWCGMGLLLARMPWNRASCDVAGMVDRLKAGAPT